MRLFFALQPDAAVSAALRDGAAPVAAALDARLMPASNLHATLLFLGETPPERLDAVRAAAATVRGAGGELLLDALDMWEKPRVLCAVSTRPAPEAGVLAERLRDAALGAGFEPDIKPFRPHVTLARKADLAIARRSSWPVALSPGFVVGFVSFVLMESRRGEHGSIYSVVDSWPLYG